MKIFKFKIAIFFKVLIQKFFLSQNLKPSCARQVSLKFMAQVKSLIFIHQPHIPC